MSGTVTTCPECRRERPGQRRFCRYCGAPITMGVLPALPVAAALPVPPPRSRAETRKGRGRGGAWIAAAAVVVVLLAALAFWATWQGSRREWNPHLRLAASAVQIASGQSVTLAWSALGVDTLMLNGEMVPSIGSRTVSPKETTTFEITAFSPDGRSESREVTVRVGGGKGEGRVPVPP